ncbi:MAG: hypothetical protein CBD97_01115 [Pelagibacteraceae bacterium TMED237]|nr:hypothetical protein [Candidatus Neomarinimicrobiota bacterium]OUW96666.1 MAG: hypothetical protein CBD97_01115 [Pelagibacteraceae bacterium TMED237]|tara:strand:- start:2871 stop:3188 length:318 start_codon:yes stop_codon:yes gene_type:complete
MENNHLFITLISSLSSQAWIQMGKIKNPVSDKIEKNLEAASMSIDMLVMIQDKTKNNLDEYEEKLLNQSIKDLKMNFVLEQNSPKEDKEDKKDTKLKAKEKKEKE